jgi:hypothetical protein
MYSMSGNDRGTHARMNGTHSVKHKKSKGQQSLMNQISHDSSDKNVKFNTKSMKIVIVREIQLISIE